MWCQDSHLQLRHARGMFCPHFASQSWLCPSRSPLQLVSVHMFAHSTRHCQNGVPSRSGVTLLFRHSVVTGRTALEQDIPEQAQEPVINTFKEAGHT